jgi:hypothetical protein
VDTASAAVNYFLLTEGFGSLNPFKTERVCRLRKSIDAAAKVRSVMSMKQFINEVDARKTLSHNFCINRIYCATHTSLTSFLKRLPPALCILVTYVVMLWLYSKDT